MIKKENKATRPLKRPPVKEKVLTETNFERKLVKQLSIIVALVGLFLYAGTINHGFVLDDQVVIQKDTSIQKGIAGVIEIFKTPYGNVSTQSYQHTLYRPVSKALLAIEWSISHGNPKTGHLINVLLFCLTGFFLMSTLHKYFKSVSLSFIVSLLFIVHPIHTEAIANIKSCDEILSFLFLILTLRSSVEYFSTSDNKHLFYTLFFFLLAMFSKESAIVFPGLFLLTWYFFFADKIKKMTISMVGYISVVLLFLLIRYSVVGNLLAMRPFIEDNSLVGAPDILHRLSTAIYIMGLYIKLLIFPHPLSSTYSFNQIPIVSINDLRFIFSFLLLLFGLIISLVHIRKKPVWGYGILFFLIASTIVSNIFIVIGTEMAERLMYLPSLGFCIVFGYFCNEYLLVKMDKPSLKNIIFNKGKLYLLWVLIFILYSFKTIERNMDWENNYTLFSHDVEVVPGSSRAHFLLGNCLLSEVYANHVNPEDIDNNINRGIEELKQSILICPSYSEPRNELGAAYYYIKKPAESLNVYEETLKYFPDDANVHRNIGIILLDMSKYEEAEMSLRKAIQLKPDYLDAYVDLTSTLDSMKKYIEAINVLNTAIKIYPGNETLNNLMTTIGEKSRQ